MPLILRKRKQPFRSARLTTCKLTVYHTTVRLTNEDRYSIVMSYLDKIIRMFRVYEPLLSTRAKMYAHFIFIEFNRRNGRALKISFRFCDCKNRTYINNTLTRVSEK
jgi:hypothetical protein